MLPNHYITKPVFIGEIKTDGQFNVVWKTKDLVPGAAWSPYLPGSKVPGGGLGQPEMRQLQHRHQILRRARDARRTWPDCLMIRYGEVAVSAGRLPEEPPG